MQGKDDANPEGRSFKVGVINLVLILSFFTQSKDRIARTKLPRRRASSFDAQDPSSDTLDSVSMSCMPLCFCLLCSDSTAAICLRRACCAYLIPLKRKVSMPKHLHSWSWVKATPCGRSSITCDACRTSSISVRRKQCMSFAEYHGEKFS